MLASGIHILGCDKLVWRADMGKEEEDKDCKISRSLSSPFACQRWFYCRDESWEWVRKINAKITKGKIVNCLSQEAELLVTQGRNNQVSSFWPSGDKAQDRQEAQGSAVGSEQEFTLTHKHPPDFQISGQRLLNILFPFV